MRAISSPEPRKVGSPVTPCGSLGLKRVSVRRREPQGIGDGLGCFPVARTRVVLVLQGRTVVRPAVPAHVLRERERFCRTGRDTFEPEALKSVDSRDMTVTFLVTLMRSGLEALYRVAEGQAGYFTTSQAESAGVSRRMLSHYASNGTLTRATHGIYRLTLFPPQRFEDLILAAMWAGPASAISHESALVVYELGDAMPPIIHVTDPNGFRGRRAGVIVHHAPIGRTERTVRDGVPVTTIERTLADVAETSDPSLTQHAAREALERGLTTRKRLGAQLQSREQARHVLDVEMRRRHVR